MTVCDQPGGGGGDDDDTPSEEEEMAAAMTEEWGAIEDEVIGNEGEENDGIGITGS